MFDAMQLLDAVMDGGMTQSSGQRLNNALGGLQQQGGILGQLMGGSQGGGGLLGNMGGIAGSLFGGGQQQQGGGLAALAGSLLGGSNNSSGGGAMTMLGALAMQALHGSGASMSSLPQSAQVMAGLQPPADPEQEQQLQSMAKLTLEAMISAAKADGEIGPREMERITGKVDESGAGREAREFMMDEMAKPLDLDALIAAVPDQQAAAQVYAASLFAIEVDTEAESDYMNRLAEGLSLDPGVREQVEQSLGMR